MAIADPRIGSVVGGRFRIEAALARGGMGVVYRAVQEPLGRAVALKLIRGDVLDGVARLRFEREARLAASLVDPHVVTVYDYGVDGDDGLFLAMELLHGETLRDRLARGPLPWSELATIATGVCSALAEAHSKGLAHRDLKPENIMLVATSSGTQARVLDFGLAKEVAALLGDTPTVTRSGGMVGTPGYIAPECLHGADVDVRMDVYAFGVMLVECLVGRHPFAAETPLKTILRASQEDVPPLAEGTRRVAGAPEALTRLLIDLCQRDPEHRPPNGGAVLARLKLLTTTTTTTATTTSLPLAAPTETMDQPRPLALATGAPAARAPAKAPRSTTAVAAIVVVAIVVFFFVVVAASQAVQVRARLEQQAWARNNDALDAVAAELAAGATVSARIDLRRSLEEFDTPRARALWSAARHAERLIDVAVDGRAQGVAFADDNHVVVGYRDGSVEDFDLRSGARIRSTGSAAGNTGFLAGDDGETVRCNYAGEVVRERGGLVASVRAPEIGDPDSDRRIPNPCLAIALSEGIVFAGLERGLMVWPRGEAQRVVDGADFTGISQLAAVGGRALASSGAGLSLIDVSAPAPVVVWRLPIAEDVRQLAVSKSGVIVVGGGGGGVFVAQMEGDAVSALRKVRTHSGRVDGIAISSDGRLLASNGEDELVRVGAIDDDAQIAVVDGPAAPIALAFSPDGHKLAMIARDGLVVVDVDQILRSDHPSAFHTRSVDALDVADAHHAWSSGADGLVLRWDLDTGRARAMFRFPSRVRDLDVSPDGKLLGVCLTDGRMIVVDARDGHKVGGHLFQGWCAQVRFLRDGSGLVAASTVGDVRRFSVGFDATQQLPRAAFVRALDVDDSGRVALGENGGIIRIDSSPVDMATGDACKTVWGVRFRERDLLASCNYSGAHAWLVTVPAAGAPTRVSVPGANIFGIDTRGDRIVVGGDGGLFRIGVGQVTAVTGPFSTVNRVRIVDDDGGALFSADDGTVRFAAGLRGHPHAFDLDLARMVPSAPAAMAQLADVRFVDVVADHACIVADAELFAWPTGAAQAPAAAQLPPGVVGVAATKDGCAVVDEQGVSFFVGSQRVAHVTHAASAIARAGSGVVVAAAAELLWLDERGIVLRQRSFQATEARGVAAPAGFSALAIDDDVVYVGRDNGTVIRVEGEALLSLRDAPETRTTAIAVGPDGLFAAGFASGVVIAWQRDGLVVDRTRLHGAIVSLTFTDGGLVIGSALGDVDVRMQDLQTERCALLREVWSTAPGARKDGRLVDAVAPAGHTCAAR